MASSEAGRPEVVLTGTSAPEADVLLEAGEDAKAARAYLRRLALGPADRSTHHNLALAWYNLGEIELAVDHLRRAASDGEDIASWAALATVIPSCPSASPTDILRTRRVTARRLAEATRWAVPPAAPRRRAGRSRLSVGYMSASFNRPAYMKPVWGLLNAHDRGRLGIHLFSDAAAEAPLTGYVPHASDRLHVTAEMKNKDVAALVRDTGIDLLVDLNGYRDPAVHLDFLRIYDEVDVALDTFPYSGGTTTMEALWQGVSVLTFRGDRWAARTTSTLLVHAGLSEFVLEDRDALVEAAVALANECETPSRLASLQYGLRRRLHSAACCDTPRMAGVMEELYARLLSSHEIEKSRSRASARLRGNSTSEEVYQKTKRRKGDPSDALSQLSGSALDRLHELISDWILRTSTDLRTRSFSDGSGCGHASEGSEECHPRWNGARPRAPKVCKPGRSLV